MRKIVLFTIVILTAFSVLASGCTKTTDWRAEYINYINNEIPEKDINGDEIIFSLIKLDDDDIPELLYSGSSPINTNLVWINDGEINRQFVGNSGFWYYENEGDCYATYFNHGIGRDLVYKFNKGKLKTVFEGYIDCTKIDITYHIGDEVVEYQKYQSKLKKKFDSDNAVSPKEYKGKTKILNAINK